MNAPLPAQSLAVIPPEQAPEHLARLGLSVEVLQAALRAGEIGAGNTTKFHPVIAAGVTRWFDTVAALRGQLSEQGWKLDEQKNSPRVLSLDRTVSVMTVGGNADTGDQFHTPRTARRKGIATQDAVHSNQLVLPFPVTTVDGDRKPAEDQATWVLLYFRSADPNEIRAELSYPTSFENGEISRWRQRIILPTLVLDAMVVPPHDAGGAADVDFRIDPR